jgi:hypothetical protein
MSRDLAVSHQVVGRGPQARGAGHDHPHRRGPENDELQKSLTFNPIYLTDGIQLSDDPFVALRSAVYALSVAHRH